MSAEETKKCQQNLIKTENRFNRRLQNFETNDSCMVDIDARMDAYIVSSPAIDALILQVKALKTNTTSLQYPSSLPLSPDYFYLPVFFNQSFKLFILFLF